VHIFEMLFFSWIENQSHKFLKDPKNSQKYAYSFLTKLRYMAIALSGRSG
jgi:hypothetical protein